MLCRSAGTTAIRIWRNVSSNTTGFFLLAAFLWEKTAALLSALQTTLLGATQPLTAPAHLSQRACGWIYTAPTWFSMPWISSPLPSRGSLNAQQLIDLKAVVQAPRCYARGYILTHSSLFPTPACKVTRLTCYLFFFAAWIFCNQ